MNKNKHIWWGILYSIVFIIFLLDFKTTAEGAKEAILLCTNTVIPALFPFMILSILLNSHYTGSRIKALTPIRKICSIPAGNESIFLMGLLGGYPVGAQGIYQAWKDNKISTNQAQRMLGYCNNPGPAFLFGMAIPFLEKPIMIWILWGIQIFGAIMTGAMLPNTSTDGCSKLFTKPMKFTSALEKAIKTMALVCGWIIIFRIMIVFIRKWCAAFLSPITLSIIAGVLELANGCTGLQAMQAQGLRFILLSGFLSFGGLCVAAQTVSVTKELGCGFYFPGKVIQCCICILLSYLTQRLVLPENMQYHIPGMLLSIFVFVPVFVVSLLYKKKIVAFIQSMMYNNKKSTEKEQAYAVSQKTHPDLRTLCSRNEI